MSNDPIAWWAGLIAVVSQLVVIGALVWLAWEIL